MKAYFFGLLLLSNIVMATEKDSIAVYLFMLESCPISQQVTPAINEIYQEFKEQGVSFQIVFPNADYTTPESLHSFLQKYHLEIPAVIDSSKSITNRWSATVTPEVVVVRKKTQAILYRGKIDNSFVSLGKKRSVVNEHYLKDAISQIVANKKIAIPQTEPIGCFIMKP
jgi:peroxiredoxin